MTPPTRRNPVAAQRLLQRLAPFRHDPPRPAPAHATPPLLMGVLNVTPDSFSDGGEFVSPDAVWRRLDQLLEQGADVIDVGAESTRPGALPVPPDEQLRRLEPVFRWLDRGRSDALLTIDTTRSEVADAALSAGFAGVNDVSGGTDDCRILTTTAAHQAVYVAMHMRGTPATMQQNPTYGPAGVVRVVAEALCQRLTAAALAGIPRHHLLADPGIGFGKTDAHNLQLLRHLPDLRDATGVPLLIGTSRKGFLGRLTRREHPHERAFATAATIAWAALHRVAVVRVHDVAEMRDVLTVWHAIEAADTLDAP